MPCQWSWKRVRCVPPAPSPVPPASALESFAENPELIVLLAATALLVIILVLRKLSKKQQPDLTATLRQVELLKQLGESEIAAAVQALEMQTYKAGDVIYRQDDQGDDCFFVDSGILFATRILHTFVEGTRVTHAKRGTGTVAEVTEDPNITRVVFDNGETHRYTPASLHKLKPVDAVEPRIVEDQQYRPGDHFGERALSRSEPRPRTITCRTDVTILRLTAASFLELQRQQERKEDLIRAVHLFETFSDVQIAALASMLVRKEFKDKEAVLTQGEEGHHFYILEEGECVATIRNGADVQQVRRRRTHNRGTRTGLSLRCSTFAALPTSTTQHSWLLCARCNALILSCARREPAHTARYRS